MLNWKTFSNIESELAGAAARLLALNEVAFLATVSATGRPRLHPFVPKIVENRLVAFIMDNSPKLTDLERRRQYSIHMLPGAEDEQFYLSGEASHCVSESSFRQKAAVQMGFATGVDEHHILVEFKVDRVLWTTWLDFGTPDHRPVHKRWGYQTAT